MNCERLFSSLAKNILTDTWRCTAPVLFEALLFLKEVNKICGMHTQLEKPWGELASVMRGRGMGEEEVQMMTVSIAEAAAMMNMEAMFLMRTSYK